MVHFIYIHTGWRTKRGREEFAVTPRTVILLQAFLFPLAVVKFSKCVTLRDLTVLCCRAVPGRLLAVSARARAGDEGPGGRAGPRHLSVAALLAAGPGPGGRGGPLRRARHPAARLRAQTGVHPRPGYQPTSLALVNEKMDKVRVALTQGDSEKTDTFCFHMEKRCYE